jgi:hypothetical protein
MDVLAMWGSQSRYIKARGTVWTFLGSLKVPPRTAEDGHFPVMFLRMAKEAVHPTAGPRDAWSRGISFLAVHCKTAELISAGLE